MLRHAPFFVAVMLAGCTADAPPPRVPIGQTAAALNEEDALAFRTWLAKYQASSVTDRPSLEAEGQKLAANRRASMRALIESDPEQAIATSISPAERDQLPDSIALEVEHWSDGIGTLHVIAGFDESAVEAPKLERFVTFAGADEVLRASVFGERAQSLSRENIRLHGVVLDGVIALTNSRLRRLFPGEARPQLPLQYPFACPVSKKEPAQELTFNGGDTLYGFCVDMHAMQFDQTLAAGENAAAENAGAAPASAWTEGPKTVLYLRVDFSDRPGDPLSVATAQNMIDGPVDVFYAANSFGKTSMSATVTPTLRLPKTQAAYQVNDQYLLLRSDALAVARDAGIDPSLYDRDIVAFASTYGGWAGRGYVGQRGVWLNGNFSLGVTAHELGHNTGVNHANFWDATGLTIIGPGTNNEYGNVYDVMGRGSGPNNHFNVWFKNVFGWVPNGEIDVVTASKTTRLFELEKPITTGLFHGAKVNRDAQRDYWLEYRPGLNTARTRDGISINWGYQTNGNGSHVLDMTPGDGARDNSTLLIGQTFSDPLAGIHFTPVKKNGTTPESVDVVVNIGAFPGNRPPVATMSASPTSATVGQMITFTATSSDPDGDTLAWAWDFGDGTWGANASSVTKSFSSVGTYSARVTVSDMKGGRVTRSVLITVGTPTNFTLSGTIKEGATPIEGARVSDGTRATFTASDGTYTLTNVPAGMLTVNAAKVDYGFARGFAAPLNVSASQTGLDFTATRVTGYQLKGKVTANSVGVAGVTVSDGTRTATTNASGDYVIANVPSGRSTVTAVKAGWRFVALGFANPVEVYGGDVSALNFIAQGISFYGQIPAAGVTTAPVVTDGLRTATATLAGSNWSYNLANVPNGSWNVTATSPGVTLTPSNFTNPVVVQGSSSSQLNFSVSATPSYSIRGTVLTGTTPLPGAVISDGTRTATSDSVGSYVLSGVPAGAYTLTATRAGYTFTPATLSVTVTNTNLTGKDFTTTTVNQPPTVSTVAVATPAMTTSTTVALSVLGADDQGESGLTYTWLNASFTSYPFTVTPNGTNAAKNAVIVFGGTGTYQLECVITDAGGLSVRAPVTVVVQQVLTDITLTPASVTVTTGGTQSFSSLQKDQFGRGMFAGSPSWTVNGGGTITGTGTVGLFTAGTSTGGPFTVSATVGGLTGTATINVAGAGAPSITGAASAFPNPVTGTTTALSVRATDAQGESTLTYTWTSTSGPAPVAFAPNGDNAAKASTATFTEAGDYSLVVSVADGDGHVVTGAVDVTVLSSLTEVVVSPAVVSVVIGETQAFSAALRDQFGAMAIDPPLVAWSVADGGTIDGNGSFTAGFAVGGPFVVTATAGQIDGTAQVTIVAEADTTAPMVSITAPIANARIESTGQVVAEASDNVAVVQVEFFVDGMPLGVVSAAPWQVAIDVTPLSVGLHSLTARAVDGAGNATTSTPVSIFTGPEGADQSPPVVAITAPASAEHTGLQLTVTAEASDDVGVTAVRFEIDGALASTVPAAPWTASVTVNEGEHTVVAIAADASGKETRSSAVTFVASAESKPQPGEQVTGGCGCTSTDSASYLAALLALVGLSRRSKAKQS